MMSPKSVIKDEQNSSLANHIRSEYLFTDLKLTCSKICSTVETEEVA